MEAAEREEHKKEVKKALEEITAQDFWDSLGPHLERKFRFAAEYMFSRGAEFALKKVWKKIKEEKPK